MKTYNLKKIIVLTGSAVVLVGCAHQQTQAYHARPAATVATAKPATPESVSAYFPVPTASDSGLLVEKIAIAPGESGQQAGYTYKVSNLTGKTLEAVTISDYLGGVSPGVNSSPQATVHDDGIVTWKLGSLGARETKIITVRSLPLNQSSLITCNWLADGRLARQ